MKIKVVRVSHLENDKNGSPLVTKTGKPYVRCLIDLEDGRKASGFGNSVTKTWNDGDEVDIELVQSGQYWNFSVPKPDLSGLADRVKALEEEVFKSRQATKEAGTATADTPGNDINLDDF